MVITKRGRFIKLRYIDGAIGFLPISCVLQDIAPYVFGDSKRKEFEKYKGALDPEFQDLVCCTESFECAKDYMGKEEFDDVCKLIYNMSIILAPDMKEELNRFDKYLET